MELDKKPGRIYRLVVDLRNRQVVFAARPFGRYKDAVSSVATAIRRHAPDGEAQEVLLQAGAPLENTSSLSQRDAPGTQVASCVARWTTLERWGRDVIERILAQNGNGHGRGGGLRPSTSKRAVSRTPARTHPPSNGDTQVGTPLRAACRRAARAREVSQAVRSNVVRLVDEHVTSGNGVSHKVAELPKPPARQEAPPPAIAQPDQAAKPEKAPPESHPRTANHKTPRYRGHLWHLGLSAIVIAGAWLGLMYLVNGGHVPRLFQATAAPRTNVAVELPFDAPEPAAEDPADEMRDATSQTDAESDRIPPRAR